ncbi:MAG: hypothetical protein ACOY82_14260 [Pseudomonadota bacterium]
MPWLTMLGYALPELFALGIALALLSTNARPGAGRRLGLIGIGVMLLASLAGFAVGIVQQVWVADYSAQSAADMSRIFSMFGALRIAINLISLGGLLTVVWGLCRATREAPSA